MFKTRGMLKNLGFLALWFPLALGALIHNLMLLTKPTQSTQIYSIKQSGFKTIADAARKNIPKQSGQVLGTSVSIGDGRILLLEDFLEGSPMEKYADLIVTEADKYNIDFRLIPAIAMCESNLGKRMPSGSFNAWGIAVYTGQQSGATFTSWDKGIRWVSQFIHDRFYKNDLVDLKAIGATWAPPSVNTGHSWANCVETFMRDIQ